MSRDSVVCATCGVLVSQGRSGAWLHTDELPDNIEHHQVDTVISRRDYLFGQNLKEQNARAPRDLELMFLERIAIALERIASSLDT